MKVADLLASRQANWKELERITEELASNRIPRRDPAVAEKVVRFGELYRAACADLALAQSYRLPDETVQYLHQLVGNAHNLLYRSRQFQLRSWGQTLFVSVPQRLYRDFYFRVAFVAFWGLFLGSGYIAYVQDNFARQVAGEAMLTEIEDLYSTPPRGRHTAQSTGMAGFYIYNNASIGLSCFATGIFLGIGSMVMLAFNAVLLGTIFGYMAGTAHWANFYEFVTAHGPFELTAVVLSAAAGMRLGLAVVDTRGASRLDSLRQEAKRSLEIVGTAAVLFFLAAFIEGYLSPSSAPYAVKAGVAVLTTLLLILYLVVLGRGGADEG